MDKFEKSVEFKKIELDINKIGLQICMTLIIALTVAYYSINDYEVKFTFLIIELIAFFLAVFLGIKIIQKKKELKGMLMK